MNKGYYVATFEHNINRLDIVNFVIKEGPKISILVAPLPDLFVYAAIKALVNTLNESNATWTCTFTKFIE